MISKQRAGNKWDGWLYPLGILVLITFSVLSELRWRRIMREVTSGKDSVSAWAQRALHDPLTGLPNRTLLFDRLENALHRAHRNRTGVAVLFIDLDDFKRVNDHHGHHVGDKILIAATERFKQCLRPSDIAARLGGDEFVVIMENVSARQAVEFIAERLRRSLQMPLLIEPSPLTVNVSIGVAMSTSANEPPEVLLQFADGALLDAKQSGRNRIVFHDYTPAPQPARSISTGMPRTAEPPIPAHHD